MIISELATFIITFNRPAILRETIRKVSSQTACPSLILIMNNGDPVDSVESALSRTDIVVTQHMMGYNAGPAAAAHVALTKLEQQGFQWIQWVDDDDPPRIQNLNERLFRHLNDATTDSIGIIGPVGSHFNIHRGIAVRVTNEEILQNTSLELQTVAGNQCMIINSAVVRAGCLPTKELFFGFEETNFCLKVLDKGFKIIVPCDLFSEYRQLAGRWKLKDSDIRKIEIPSWRSYYSARNLIFMFLHEFKKPTTVCFIVARVLGRAVVSFFSKGFRRGTEETYFTVLAIFHGIFGHLGLTVKPVKKSTVIEGK